MIICITQGRSLDVFRAPWEISPLCWLASKQVSVEIYEPYMACYTNRIRRGGLGVLPMYVLWREMQTFNTITLERHNLSSRLRTSISYGFEEIASVEWGESMQG